MDKTEADISSQARRLVECGFTIKNAQDVCERYAAQYGAGVLEEYVRVTELLFNDYKQYPKEI